MKNEAIFKNTTSFVKLLPLVVVAALCAYASVAQAGSDALQRESSTYISKYSEMAFEGGYSGGYQDSSGDSGSGSNNYGESSGGGSGWGGGGGGGSSNAGEGGGYGGGWSTGNDSSCCSGGSNDSGGNSGGGDTGFRDTTNGGTGYNPSDFYGGGEPMGLRDTTNGGSGYNPSDFYGGSSVNSVGGIGLVGGGPDENFVGPVNSGHGGGTTGLPSGPTATVVGANPAGPTNAGSGAVRIASFRESLDSVSYGGATGRAGRFDKYIGAVDVSHLTNFNVNDIRRGANGGGIIGTTDDGITVLYSPFLSQQAGHDVWVGNVPPPDSGGSSGGGSGGSGGGSDGTNPNGSDNSTPTTVSLADGGTPWGGYWQGTRSCTSSGKGGQSCSVAWAWVPTPVSDTSPCETASCSSAASSLGGGDSGGGATQQDLSIDATPDLVKNGDSSTITWSSINADSCTVTGPNDFSANGTSGSQVAVGITQQSLYTLICEFASGPKMTTATVNVIPVWREL